MSALEEQLHKGLGVGLCVTVQKATAVQKWVRRRKGSSKARLDNKS